jgi:cholesterol transport system auxiliary component
MVNRIKSLITLLIVIKLTACMPVSLSNTNQYTLDSFDATVLGHAPQSHRTLLISQTTAADGYQTEQMLYITKPYQLSAFSKNVWITPPADMLFPLLSKPSKPARPIVPSPVVHSQIKSIIVSIAKLLPCNKIF